MPKKSWEEVVTEVKRATCRTEFEEKKMKLEVVYPILRARKAKYMMNMVMSNGQKGNCESK